MAKHTKSFFARQKRRPIADRLRAAIACSDGCEGRCVECPDDLMREAADKIEALHAALEMTQFGHNHARCPVCAGWNMSPAGETDKVHTKNCPVGRALSVPL